MDEVKRLRAEAQKITERAQERTEWAQRYTEQAQYCAEWAQRYTEKAAKLNKQADELEQADA